MVLLFKCRKWCSELSMEGLRIGRLKLTDLQVGAWRDCHGCGFNVSGHICL
jgi:hypothetical protein